MSAQRDLDQPPVPRQMRFPAPLPVRATRALPLGVYTIDSPTVPYPVALAPLLRYPNPGRHWALILGHIYHNATMLRYTPLQMAAAWRLRELLEHNARDPRAERYVRLLVPVAACKHCGKAFLKESARRIECSDRCRRLETLPDHGAGVPLTYGPCVRCGATLPVLRRRYCSESCHRAAERERRNGR